MDSKFDFLTSFVLDFESANQPWSLYNYIICKKIWSLAAAELT
jgi:hypothetical protein